MACGYELAARGLGRRDHEWPSSRRGDRSRPVSVQPRVRGARPSHLGSCGRQRRRSDRSAAPGPGRAWWCRHRRDGAGGPGAPASRLARWAGISKSRVSWSRSFRVDRGTRWPGQSLIGRAGREAMLDELRTEREQGARRAVALRGVDSPRAAAFVGALMDGVSAEENGGRPTSWRSPRSARRSERSSTRLGVPLAAGRRPRRLTLRGWPARRGRVRQLVGRRSLTAPLRGPGRALRRALLRTRIARGACSSPAASRPRPSFSTTIVCRAVAYGESNRFVTAVSAFQALRDEA